MRARIGSGSSTVRWGLAITLLLGVRAPRAAHAAARGDLDAYEQADTRALVARVRDAARLIETQGEAAFTQLRVEGGRWRRGDSYIFVLDTGGGMRVHPDPALEGHDELGLRDVDGRAVIRGLLDAAIGTPGKPDGWYHYRWPVPGGLLPRWKSSYVRLAVTPSGSRYVVGSGVYNDRMERAFAVDLVRDAAALVEQRGDAAFPELRDRTGRFFVKDAYVFVVDPRGVELVNPAFPNLEGRNLLALRDTNGAQPVREMLEVARTQGAGWVQYLWPKPGEHLSTQKSAFVMKVRRGTDWVLLGCGVYLADAPRTLPARELTAPELMSLVRDAAAELARRGDDAFPSFRVAGSRWRHDDQYLFVWRLDGLRRFHAVEPALEGTDAREAHDVLGKPYGRMALDVARSPAGEGWVHYMYPEPGELFPTWKSVFVKRVAFPSGKAHLVGAGIYNMALDRAFIEDVVHQAAALLTSQGTEAFHRLRDPKGPFVFMDTYVFVDRVDGVEVVNPGQPSLEGVDVLPLRDAGGKEVAREYIDLAMARGSGWVTYDWYRPGRNAPARKETFVQKVRVGAQIYVIGAGRYLSD